MLPKKFRLHSDKDIKSLVQGGKTFFLPQLTIKYRENSQKTSRIGFVVSTRVDKRAVIRNKIKRRLREVLRAELPTIKDGFDLLFSAKKSCAELSLGDLKKQVQFALKTTRLYKDKETKNVTAQKN